MRLKIFFVVLWIFVFTANIHAQQIHWITSQELIKNASRLNGETVVFTGEVIGDVMRRGDFVWLNIQDDYGTIGVWAPFELAQEITYLGDYNHKGDIVAVEGVFLRADPELAGELCIRAQNIRIVFPGFFIFHQLSFLKIKMAVLLFIFMIFLVGLRIFLLKKEKKVFSKKI